MTRGRRTRLRLGAGGERLRKLFEAAQLVFELVGAPPRPRQLLGDQQQPGIVRCAAPQPVPRLGRMGQRRRHDGLDGGRLGRVDPGVAQLSHVPAPSVTRCTPLAEAPAALSAEITSTRRSGGAMNIMNPPPPAPDTLPPIAPACRAQS